MVMAGAVDITTTEYDDLLQAVGQAISDWAFVEEGLFEIFFCAMGCPALGPPACAFIAADNIRAKIAMVDSMVRHSKATQPMLPDWIKIHERCNTSRGHRNDIAHRKAVILQLGKSKPRPALIAYAHDLRPTLKGEPHKKSRIELTRVRELSREFRKLGRDLQRFAHEIPQPRVRP